MSQETCQSYEEVEGVKSDENNELDAIPSTSSVNKNKDLSVNSSGAIMSSDSESEWEDQDTSNEEEEGSQSKLTIDEAYPSASTDNLGNEDDRGKIPENILRECRKLISSDKRLDKKARKNNMSSKQVKLVLKHIFSSEQIIAMLRDKGLLTSTSKQDEDIEAAEPKMTRSVARTLTESGDICPWIIHPKTPAKEPPPEIVSLVTEEFPDDEDGDPEYTPDLEPSRVSDDEDSFMETSEAGTPNTQRSRSTVHTPISEIESPALGFRTPGLPLMNTVSTPRTSDNSPRSRIVSRNLHFEDNTSTPQTWEGYGTRSRRPMTELNIEELEQQFIPFDITPDMYDCPIENDEYSEFLQALYSGPTQTSVVDSTHVDDDMDPEYSFPPDEEDIRLKDPEELRHDRATKISRKELADLMAELLDCGNEANMRSEREIVKKKGKHKKKRGGAALPATPPQNQAGETPDNSEVFINTPVPPETAACLSDIDNTSIGEEQNISNVSVNVQIKLENSKNKSLTKNEEENKRDGQSFCMSEEEIHQLAAQVQQHIQLITQMRLITTNTKMFENVSVECDQMLAIINDKASQNPYSVMNQSNLGPSLAAIQEWSNAGQSSTVQKIKNRQENRKKRIMKHNPTKEFTNFISNLRIFVYPDLLTLASLVTSPGKVMWTKSEDMLMAQGLEWINYLNNSSKCSQNKKRFLSKISLSDLAKTLRIKRIPAKSADQIYFRLKNLRRESLSDDTVFNREDMNPVVQFFSHGVLPTVDAIGLHYPTNYTPLTIRNLVEAGNRELPDVYVESVLNSTNTTSKLLKTKRPRKIEPKETIEVIPDIPSDSDFSSDSDSDCKPPVMKREKLMVQSVAVKKDKESSVDTKPVQILPRVSPVRNKSRYQLLLPQPSTSSADNQMISCHKAVAIFNSSCTTTPLGHLPGLRTALCVDGNDTPVSMSESDTPTTLGVAPFFPAKTNQPAKNTNVIQTKKTPPSANNKDPTPVLSNLTAISKPIFRSPEKTGTLSYFSTRSPMKSPLKSPLKSLTNTYHRSPLKAASDRIIRKYTSPLKRKRTSRAGPSVTPKRLMMMTSTANASTEEKIQSPRTPKTSDVPNIGSQISPRGGGESELDTPTGLARRKTRVQRETEATVLLLSESLETPEEKEARELRESQELFSSIQSILTENSELTPRYEEIMNSAGEQGVRQTYSQLNHLMQDYPDVQEMLLDLLTEEDALCLGMNTYNAYCDRNRLKRFLRKLGIVYKHQPAYHVKVLKELETLSKDPTLTSERLKDVSCQLFRNNQHLMEEFQMLIPGIPPPQSMLPSPEMLELDDEAGSEGEGGVEDGDEYIHVPRSPDTNTDNNMGNIRFSGGRCYVVEGKMLKPATIDKVVMK